MSVTARTHTKLAAALLTAGMVATAPAVVGAGPQTLPVVSNIDVRSASFITDGLNAFGDVVSAAADAFMIGSDFALGLNYYWDDSDYGWGVPINPVFLAVAAAQNPGSALSYFLQTYLNPSDIYGDPNDNTIYYYSYPWYVKSAVIDPLVGLLPVQLGAAVNTAINDFANAINTAFASLPDPTPTVTSMWDQYNTTGGRMVYALQSALGLPATLATAVVYYLAYLPETLEGTAEAAIRNPANIPGLLSSLVYDALDPNLYGGLLGNLSYNLFKPSFFLPAPIGESSLGAHDGLAYGAYQNFANAVSGLLSVLPTPVVPVPFPSAATAPTAPTAAKSAEATASETSSTESPTVDSQGQSAGKATRSSAADRHANSAKPSAKKAKGDSTSKGGSARANKSHGAA
ncbi:hypothetical protein [Mycobacterium sp. RTGN5]|uniref:hypothetical protein n=1 Tax=Mycobacterium sp. RTGN5 TaxID=3016522 RepID=UPI0029C9747D|nr:hypothetical protein [Mycobacterium sp. RTGN5]